MNTFFEYYKIVVVAYWIIGFVGLFIGTPTFVMLMFAFPAGWAAGTIIGEWLYE